MSKDAECVEVAADAVFVMEMVLRETKPETPKYVKIWQIDLDNLAINLPLSARIAIFAPKIGLKLADSRSI